MEKVWYNERQFGIFFTKTPSAEDRQIAISLFGSKQQNYEVLTSLYFEVVKWKGGVGTANGNLVIKSNFYTIPEEVQINVYSQRNFNKGDSLGVLRLTRLK